MADVYVKLDDVISIIKEVNWNLGGLIQHLKEHCPTADVAPRALYESLKNENIETIKAIADSHRAYARDIFNDLEANQIPCVSEDGAVFFCIKSKTFKQLRKKHMRANDEV